MRVAHSDKTAQQDRAGGLTSLLGWPALSFMLELSLLGFGPREEAEGARALSGGLAKGGGKQGCGWELPDRGPGCSGMEFLPSSRAQFPYQ